RSRYLRRVVAQHRLAEGLIFSEEKIHGRAVGGFAGFTTGAKIRNVITALLEILVARGALLSVPALLIHQNNRRQDRKLFHGKGHMRQVGDRAVAVLEIKSVEKLLGLLLADLLQRFLHR